MNKMFRGITYAYHRNIGWQDRTVRTAFGLVSLAGAIYYYPERFGLATLFIVLFAAQVVTVLSSRCMICYFLGQCTITPSEKKSLEAKGVPYEKHNQ